MRIFLSENIFNVVARACKYLLLAFISVATLNVFLRFGFNAGSVKLQDLLLYCFAVFVPLSIALGFTSDKHVRAGSFDKEPTSSNRIALVGLVEIGLGIFSFSALLIFSLPGVASSWAVLEGSAEPDGLGGYFLVRTVLPVMCILIIWYFCRKLMMHWWGGK